MNFGCNQSAMTYDSTTGLMRGSGMLAVRAAILALVFGLLTSHSTFFSASTKSPAKDGVFAAFRLDSSAVRPVVVELPGSSTLAHFAPWKARPKIVLVEANYQFSEESDLGPVLLPGGLSASRRRLLQAAPRIRTALSASLLKLLARSALPRSVQRVIPSAAFVRLVASRIAGRFGAHRSKNSTSVNRAGAVMRRANAAPGSSAA